MTEIELVGDIEVELIKTDFDDRWPVLAARTSTLGGQAEPDHRAGLIRRLISEGHWVPFEHMSATWRITAPIFVWRQAVKHRAGVSLSEESGRYRELKPRFYLPGAGRPMAQVGKPMDYDIRHDEELAWEFRTGAQDAYRKLWRAYEEALTEGVAREVARMVLPVSTMSTGVVTMNARALMHFLTLRTSNTGKSHPQWEIERLAMKLEATLVEFAPLTAAAFNESGRTA